MLAAIGALLVFGPLVSQTPHPLLQKKVFFSNATLGSAAFAAFEAPDRITVKPIFQVDTSHEASLSFGGKNRAPMHLAIAGNETEIAKDEFSGLKKALKDPAVFSPGNCTFRPDFHLEWFSKGKKLDLITCFGCGHLEVYYLGQHKVSAPLNDYPLLKRLITKQYTLREQQDHSAARVLTSKVFSLMKSKIGGRATWLAKSGSSSQVEEVVRTKVLGGTMIRSLADIIGAGKLAEWARIRTKHEIPSTADGLCRIILDTTPVVELQFKFQYRSLDVFIDGRKVSNAYFASFGDQIQELLESPDN